jgi:hypothetical protein
MDNDLIKAVKALLSSIEAMKFRPDWFGPFSEFEEEDNDRSITCMTVRWPGLTTRVDAVKSALRGHSTSA